MACMPLAQSPCPEMGLALPKGGGRSLLRTLRHMYRITEEFVQTASGVCSPLPRQNRDIKDGMLQGLHLLRL